MTLYLLCNIALLLQLSGIFTVEFVTAVLTVLVAVTLVAGLDTLPQVRAGELSRGADLGGTLSLVTEVLTVRDPVTLPGLGETLVGTVAAELFCAAGLLGDGRMNFSI